MLMTENKCVPTALSNARRQHVVSILADSQKSFRSSGASKILSGVDEMYLVFLTEAGVVA